MRRCPQCEGEGTCTYEEGVPDYVYGGYLQEVIDTCDMCYGYGEVEDWDEEEEDDAGTEIAGDPVT